ncbi:hypothetical protein RJ639_033111, partial [Escallonia herrerae]
EPKIDRPSVCNCSYSRSADQMCRQDSRVHLSAEEEIAAEESLTIYCKPVELYNILQRRAIRNVTLNFIQPSFLQRCLHYKIQAKHKRRIQLTISLLGSVDDGSPTRSLFPLYILLARPVSNVHVAEHSSVYRFSRACVLTACTGVEELHRAQAKFILPDMNKLSAEAQSGSLAILLVSCAGVASSLFGSDVAMDQSDTSSFPLTEDFSCPFCLVKCASFKGLRHHLPSSHDLFNFEFWVTEEYQAVNVFVKTDSWRSEIVADGVDPKQQTFFYCSKRLRCRKSRSLVRNGKHVHPFLLDSDFPTAISEIRDKNDGQSSFHMPNSVFVFFIFQCQYCRAEFVERDTSSPNVTGVSSATAHSYADPECVQSIPGSNIAPPAMLQFAKTRKLSVERTDPRNRALLQKRQFFHSHRAQPMSMEQVLSDRDSEDEVDDDVADFEDRRMLDDFVDVTKDEKQMMHLWNSFVRKQRVLADGHIPWACEAFSKLHGQDLVQAPALLWCWRLFMVKLWNHGLLDARSMNNCNLILDQCQR